MENILQQHLSLCERIYDLILDENQILKTTGKSPDAPFLERKRSLLQLLDASLEKLRTGGEASEPQTQAASILINKAQQVIMKTLLLDRENEQMLLKYTMGDAHPPQERVKPTLGSLQRLYGSRCAQGLAFDTPQISVPAHSTESVPSLLQTGDK
jgi:hypothetical protein